MKRRNPPDSVAMVNAQLNKLAKAQEKTAVLQAKTQNQIQQLSGYNSQRDEDLKEAGRLSLVNALANAGFMEIEFFGQRQFYTDVGEELTEWDGVVVCDSPDGIPHVFLLDIKQRMSKSQISRLPERVSETKVAIQSQSDLSNLGIEARRRVTGQRILNSGQNRKVKVVAGSYSLTRELCQLLNRHGYGWIRSSGDDLVVDLY
jgi:hypothetical protein